MRDDVRTAIETTVSGSDAGTMTFPQVVEMLARAGVERYHTDLQRSEKTFYMPHGESLVIGTHAIDSAVAADFDVAGVEAAVRTIQRGEIDYMQFCERIAGAGCASYIVSLAGRRAVYYGRTGEAFVEPFPAL